MYFHKKIKSKFDYCTFIIYYYKTYESFRLNYIEFKRHVGYQFPLFLIFISSIMKQFRLKADKVLY